VNVNGQSQPKDYIDKYKPISAKLSAEYEIPQGLILGIAIIESGWGKSKNCKLLNNHFGIVGKNKLRKKGLHSKFKQYENGEDSYKDFCKTVSHKKYYKKLKGNDSIALWIDAMSKSGYSEQPLKWKNLISGAIKKYKLGSLKIAKPDNEPQ
jgi:uncharacterized FlgJ-related protein